MESLQIPACCISFISLSLVTTALVSNHWIVDSTKRHAGLWEMCYDTMCVPHGIYVLDFIHITRAFLLIGMIASAVSFFSFCASFYHTHVGSISITMFATWSSFVAGIFSIVAMSVFTRIYSYHFSLPGTWLGWSFGVGWASVPLFLLTSVFD